MCNVDEGEEKPIPRKSKGLAGRKCVKCDQPGILVTRYHDAFCRDCFIVYVVHKFRSVIGKSKLIRDGEEVLVAFSGGANSAALLQLISEGLSERAHKKLRFRPSILFVDESSLLDMTEDDRYNSQASVLDFMGASGFPSYITHLEQAVQKDLTSMDETGQLFWAVRPHFRKEHHPTGNAEEQLKMLISSLKSATSKEDFVRNLRKQLIVAIARKLGIKKVMTGESSTRLAVEALTNMSQGRGSQIALDTAFSDARYDDIMMVRPLRDLNAKELALYNRLFGVESTTYPSLTTKADVGASIERLTETFVTGLQTDYPATISNIVRTSQKLLQPDTQETDKCSFCQSPLDTNVGLSSALSAIKFSRKLSQFPQGQRSEPPKSSSDETSSKLENPAGLSLSAVASDKAGPSSGSDCVTEAPILSTMCFGCQLSLRDFGDDLDTLPQFISSRAGQPRKANREMLREQIADCLLDDDDADT